MPAAAGRLGAVLVGEFNIGKRRSLGLDAIDLFVVDGLVDRHEGLDWFRQLHRVQVVDTVAVVTEHQLARLGQLVWKERAVEDVRVAIHGLGGEFDGVEIVLAGAIRHEIDLRAVLRERGLSVVVESERQLYALLRTRQVDAEQLLVTHHVRGENDALSVRRPDRRVVVEVILRQIRQGFGSWIEQIDVTDAIAVRRKHHPVVRADTGRQRLVEVGLELRADLAGRGLHYEQGSGWRSSSEERQLSPVARVGEVIAGLEAYRHPLPDDVLEITVVTACEILLRPPGGEVERVDVDLLRLAIDRDSGELVAGRRHHRTEHELPVLERNTRHDVAGEIGRLTTIEHVRQVAVA